MCSSDLHDSALQGGPGFAAFSANVGGLVMLLTSLGAVLACKVVLSILLGLAPLVAGLLLFDATRGLVEGWLKAMIALAVLPMVATLGLALELALHTLRQPVTQVLGRLPQRLARGGRHFGRSGGCGSAHIGHKVEIGRAHV